MHTDYIASCSKLRYAITTGERKPFGEHVLFKALTTRHVESKIVLLLACQIMDCKRCFLNNNRQPHLRIDIG